MSFSRLLKKTKKLFAVSRLRYQKITAKIHPAPIFILGYPKSGTTVISSLLSEASGQPLTTDLFYRLDPKREQKLPEKLFCEKEKMMEFVHQHKFFFSTPLNKSPLFTFLYAELKHCFPQAKFIFIARHPADTLRSYLNRRGIPGHLDQLPEDKQRHLNRFASIPPSVGSHYIEKMANRWHTASETYFSHSDDMLLIRYEDFMLDKVGSIHQLCEQAGLTVRHDISPFLERQYQPRGNRDVSWHEFFGANNLATIERICAEPMARFGYLP